jgi:hypothetical protein
VQVSKTVAEDITRLVQDFAGSDTDKNTLHRSDRVIRVDLSQKHIDDDEEILIARYSCASHLKPVPLVRLFCRQKYACDCL